jgi:DNA invertase Pin-like site-specific DNA recombinase
MSGIVSYAMTQANTSRLYNMRFQQQLLSQGLQNLHASAFSLNSLMDGLDAQSPYAVIFQQQMAAVNQMEKQMVLQQQRLNQEIQIVQADTESQKKITDNWLKSAFSYLV